MATTPEYGEELLIEEREKDEERAGEASRVPLPKSEVPGQAEVAELDQAEEELRRPTLENHEAHRPGTVCDNCGLVLEREDDARLTVDGRWVHEVCPPSRVTGKEVRNQGL